MLVLILSILFSMTLTLAQSGCFLYSESPFYCSDLSEEKAEAECLLYEDCALNNVFHLEESCIKKETFPECKVILCKDNCQKEVAGKCFGGEILITEKDQWCNSGCCYFEYYQNNYCNYKENKASCETEARNKDAITFSFDLNKKEAQCLNFCVQEEYLNPLIGSILTFEDVSAKDDNEIVTLSKLDFGTDLDEKDQELLPTDLENEKNNWPWILLIGLIFVGLVIYFYKKPKEIKNALNAIINFFKIVFLTRRKKEKSRSLKTLKTVLLPFRSNSKLRKIIFKKSKERKHKIEEFHRSELLNEFGYSKKLTLGKKQKKIKDLKKLVGSYERKLKYHPKEITKQDVSAIKKLEQLTKSKEENFINIEDLKKNTSLSSKNSDKKTKDTISELKALANKVNK